MNSLNWDVLHAQAHIDIFQQLAKNVPSCSTVQMSKKMACKQFSPSKCYS